MDNNTTRFEIDNLPNRLTLFRVILVPIIVLFLHLQSISYPWLTIYHDLFGKIAAFIFVMASITDFVDGHLARKRNMVTVFGSFMDPIADKFLTVSSLMMLQSLGRLPILIVIILILREFYMTSLRLLAMTEGVNVAVNSLGKWKTATQMLGLPMLMLTHPVYSLPLPFLGKFLIFVSCFLSIYSSVQYSLGFIKKLKQITQQKRQQLLSEKQEGPHLQDAPVPEQEHSKE